MLESCKANLVFENRRIKHSSKNYKKTIQLKGFCHKTNILLMQSLQMLFRFLCKSQHVRFIPMMLNAKRVILCTLFRDDGSRCAEYSAANSVFGSFISRDQFLAIKSYIFILIYIYKLPPALLVTH